MNNVNKTLYIPLYGKAYVSKRSLFLSDKRAEEIWEKEAFELKGKAKSKWLAYYMGIRSAVFDDWLREKLKQLVTPTVIHIGCGLDSRILRVGTGGGMWYDVDFAEVIEERKKYFSEFDGYAMISGDVREKDWLDKIAISDSAVVIMEGVSMYLELEELLNLLENLCSRFDRISLLLDSYTPLAAKLSRFRNPIKNVGVNRVCGLASSKLLENEELKFVKEHNMTPKHYIDELKGTEKFIFKKIYASNFSKKLYKLYEYLKCK